MTQRLGIRLVGLLNIAAGSFALLTGSYEGAVLILFGLLLFSYSWSEKVY